MSGFAVLPSAIARDSTIEPPLKVLLLVLASYAGADQTAWPNLRTLETAVGIKERGLRDWLREGERRGLIVTTRRLGDDGSHISNLYRLNFAKWGEDMALQNMPTPMAENAVGVGHQSAGGGALGCR